MRKLLPALLLGTVVTVAIGCQNNNSNTGSETPATTSPSTTQSSTAGQGGDAALIAAGKEVFTTNGCGNCHAVGGQGGGRAPDLSRVGAVSEHTTEWLVAHVKDPKTHNPRSRMPSFKDKISDKDLLALGAYLSSLK